MAEAFLRKYGNNDFEAFSAGLVPKGIHPLTVQVLEEVGLDLSQHTSKHIDEYLNKVDFSYLITVCDDADKNCPTIWLQGSKRMHWSFEDPAKFEGSPEEKLAKFRQVRDLIESKIKEWVASQPA